MLLYRLSRKAYASDLSGSGAKLYPGRWNSKGVPLIYCGLTPLQCLVEVLVHLDYPPVDYCSVQIIVPDLPPLVQLDARKLTRQWRDDYYNAPTRAVGDGFVASNHLVMRVPSAVVQGAFNFILNPTHPQMKKVKIGVIEPFIFDKRLFKKR